MSETVSLPASLWVPQHLGLSSGAAIAGNAAHCASCLESSASPILSREVRPGSCPCRHQTQEAGLVCDGGLDAALSLQVHSLDSSAHPVELADNAPWTSELQLLHLASHVHVEGAPPLGAPPLHANALLHAFGDVQPLPVRKAGAAILLAAAASSLVAGRCQRQRDPTVQVAALSVQPAFPEIAL